MSGSSPRAARALSEQLAARIEQLMVEEPLEPGTPLIERTLASRLMVSRSPVRAALRILAERGSVGPRSQGGYVVRRRPKDFPFSAPFESEPPDEATYLRIGADHLAGRLPERISENDLMRRYELTKARLGSLLRRIANEGWIERLPGHGWQFLPVLTSGDTYDQAYRVRMLLEPAALSEPGFIVDVAALRRCLAEQLALIEGAVHWVSPAQLFDANTRVHETIAACSSNVFFLDSLKRINRLRRLMEYRMTIDRDAAARRCSEHKMLIELLLDDQLTAAADFIRRHLHDAALEKAMGLPPARDD